MLNKMFPNKLNTGNIAEKKPSGKMLFGHVHSKMRDSILKALVKTITQFYK